MSDDAHMPEGARTPETAKVPTGSGLTGQVADAVRGNWVDTVAPPAARPYLRLSRADRPAGTWLLYLPCVWGVALAVLAGPGGWGVWDLWIVAGCGIGAFLMRGAGCTWNDITDRDFDGRVARTRSRPIPSGQVTVRQAVAWMVVQALAGAVVLFTFSLAAILLGIGSLALVAVYPFAKRFTWWPQVFLGLAFNWGVLLAYAAHAGGIGAPAILAYMAGICWTLFYDTIYAHQDIEDDALIGVKSTARLFGTHTKAWLRGFMVAAVILLLAAVSLAIVPRGGGLAPLMVAMAGVWGFGAHLGWQLARLDIEDPAVCMTLFRANRDAGLILALFLAGAAAL